MRRLGGFVVFGPSKSDLRLVQRWSNGDDGHEMGLVFEWEVDLSDLDTGPPLPGDTPADPDLEVEIKLEGR